MNIAIVYDSSTGTTAKAAEAMGKTFAEQGHTCTVQSVTNADPADVLSADFICVGSWVKGLFFILQHPTEGTMQFIERLGDMSGKKVVVFCTYKLAIGKSMQQMVKAVEAKGGNVVAQFKYRSADPGNAFASFATSLS
jgi:flavodoxin